MFFYIFLSIIILLYYITTRKYNYFKNKKVPHIQPTFLLGNYGDYILQKKSIMEVIQDICKKLPNEKFIGAYYATEPALIPIDPDIIKLIVTKDFYYFNSRELSEHNQKTSKGLNLFTTQGDNWRILRQNMTPLFSSAKMKNMFHLIQKCSYTYETMLDKEVAKTKEIDVRKITAKFTLECIVSCAFGVEPNVMKDDPKTNPFSIISKSLSQKIEKISYLRILRSIWPNIFNFSGMGLYKKQYVFFTNMITSVMCERNYQPSNRHDFIDLVSSWKQNKYIVGDSIKSMKTGNVDKVFLAADDKLLTQQCFIFFTAGFDSSSSTISFTLYELAKNQEIQRKVIDEIDDYLSKNGNNLLYECVFELHYLEAVIDETLRMYPVLGVIKREQMEEYTFPNGVKTEKGMRIHIPVYYMHNNPEYFPKPEVFRPERFLGEEKRNIKPYTYFPFGEGPRFCIGLRFAKMQMMACFITMLKKYRLELAEDMPKKLKFKPGSLFTEPVCVGGIRLKFIEREGWDKRIYSQ